MPFYEFRCEDCGERLTIRRSFSDTSLPRCTRCKGKDLTRLISQVSVISSEQERARDVSWIDRNLAGRMKRKASGKLNPGLQDTLDRMESS